MFQIATGEFREGCQFTIWSVNNDTMKVEVKSPPGIHQEVLTSDLIPKHELADQLAYFSCW